jgi:hypothetical protein
VGTVAAYLSHELADLPPCGRELAPLAHHLLRPPPVPPARVAGALQPLSRPRSGARSPVQPAASVGHCRAAAGHPGSRPSAAPRRLMSTR